MQEHSFKSRNFLGEILQGYIKYYINIELHVWKKIKIKPTFLRQDLSGFKNHVFSYPL